MMIVDFDTAKVDFARYLGLADEPESQMEELLTRLIEQKGVEVLTQPIEFSTLAVSQGLTRDDSLGLALVLGADGAQQLFNGRVHASDIDRLVRNAENSTGLTRTSIMRFVRALCLAVGAAIDVPPEGVLVCEEDNVYLGVEETAFVLPIEAYERCLSGFRPSFQKALTEYRNSHNGGDAGVQDRSDLIRISEASLKQIEPLVAAGVPEAKYYLGTCLLYGLSGNPSPEQGLRLLDEAAAAGNAEANAELGDYYFSLGVDSWEDAYRYYTGFGSIGLSEERLERVQRILDRKGSNLKLLLSCFMMLVLMVVLVVAAPGIAVHAALRIFGSICLLFASGVLMIAILRYRVGPYDNFSFVPAAMFSAWTLYYVIRFLF